MVCFKDAALCFGMNILNKINYILDKRQKRNLVILLLIIIVGSFVELLGVSMISPIISIINSPELINKSRIYIWLGKIFRLNSLSEYVIFLCFLLALIYICKNLYIAAEYNLQYRFVFNNQRRLSVRMFVAYVRQPYLYFVNHNVADLQRNITQDVVYFYICVLKFLELLMESTVCIVLVTYLLIKDFTSTSIIIFLLGSFLIIYTYYSRKRLGKIGNLSREKSGEINKWILQSFGGIKDIKILNKESYFIDNYSDCYKLYAEYQRKQSFASIIPRPIMETVCICGLLFVMGFRILFGVNPSEFVPILAVFAVAAFRMLPSFNRISNSIGQIAFYKASLNALYEDLIEIDGMVKHECGEDVTFKIGTDIVLEDISFKYNDDGIFSLDNINLIIEKNKTTAFVGPSGAGKSTIADIIMGVVTPLKGKVLVDKVNIFDFLDSWHHVVGYIPQVIYLMDDTIRRNVAFGVKDEDISDEKVWEALKDAQLYDYIRGQPDGLDTIVGDKGIRLSGGQRQRLGIARTLYFNPKVLLLDEATSALDNDTETAVMEAIEKLHGTRTMIIIAHRLTTIRNADRIYYVADNHVEIKDDKWLMHQINIKSEEER